MTRGSKWRGHADFLAQHRLSDVLPDMQLARFAASFARSTAVAVGAAHPNCAAFLSLSATKLAICGADSQLLADMTQWFGRSFSATLPAPMRARLAVGLSGCGEEAELAPSARRIEGVGKGNGVDMHYALPESLEDFFMPSDGDCAFNAKAEISDGMLASRTLLAPMPPSLGGSNGRVAVVVGAQAFLEGAIDEALALVALLRAEGLAAYLTDDARGVSVEDVDLVHIVGTRECVASLELVKRARARGIPTILTANFEDSGAGGYWGLLATRRLVDHADDERTVMRSLHLLGVRQISVNDIVAHQRREEPDADARRALIRDVDVVICATESERGAIADYSGRRRRLLTISPPVYQMTHSAPIGHLVSDTPFMLLHSAIDDRSNAYIVVRAATMLGLPLVVCGPIVDRALYRETLAIAGPTVSFLPTCSPEEIQTLYERARVFIDAAWIGASTTRLLAAALSGCVIACSEARHLPEAFAGIASRFDPAKIESVRSGMSAAWVAYEERIEKREQAYSALAELASPALAIRGILAAYATLATSERQPGGTPVAVS